MTPRNSINTAKLLPTTLIIWLSCGNLALADGWDPSSKSSNRDSIMNTRHNLTQSYLPNGFAGFMDYARNNYGEVCVYCHTPHGSSGQVGAPLWNRTINTGVYQVYDQVLTSGQVAVQPGSSSLTCLSCHDGTIAIDSIINMPGSGRYLSTQETSQSTIFLDSWTNSSGIQTIDHGVMWSAASGYFVGPYNCNRCHTEGNVWGIPDFAPFDIGEDLRNDHPIGVTLPVGSDFMVLDGTLPNKMEFFDKNGNSRADKNEPRFYFNGTDYRLECASCHDPHGVAPSAGAEMYPSFLRKSNVRSELCLTCHVK